MKFNWGTGIFIFLVLFILGIIAFYVYITNLDIKLVEDNYYEKELAYQQKIDKINNTASLGSGIEIIQDTGILVIQFPSIDPGLKPEGSVWFYRPSDPEKDFTVALQLNDSLQQVFDISKMDKGRWVIKLDWFMGEKEYYFEEGVVISH